MEHDLINTIVACIVSAFIFGFIAKKLRLPTILGYLIAGIAIGPHSPGIVADVEIAKQLAEIGIILLMFGVGLHFSIKDLMNVRKIALPGAVFQMLSATLIGAGLIYVAGFSWTNAIIFGFSLSVASTVVLLRALERRKAVETDIGKIAVGWLIVEDIAMVFAIVLLPVVANILHKGEVDSGLILTNLAMVVFKIALFVFIMIVAGRRLLPWALVRTARTKSRELASLGVLAISLGFAFIAYEIFDASFALGAFLAGVVIGESEIGSKAVDQTLPMRDTFAVLFFVSVGMLFEPIVLIQEPLLVISAVLIVIIGKAVAALLIVRLFTNDPNTGWTIAISLAQIGEFSFIFAGMAVTSELLDKQLYNVILAAALLSISMNHFLFNAFDKYRAKTLA